MTFTPSPKWQLSIVAVLFTFIIGCSDSSDDDPSEPELTYDAEIVWTEYGIPHVVAQDWGSLGYGYAYAFAQHNYCIVMKEYVRAKGESARYLGDEGSINDDLIYKLFNNDERIQRIFIDAVPEYIVDLSEGFAAGLNRYLAETGVDNLPEGEEGCRGEEWVRDVDVFDIVRLMHKVVLIASAGPLADFMVAAVPEDTIVKYSPPTDLEQLIASLANSNFDERMGMPKSEEIGSNAYAVGEQGSQTNSSVLLGNPHFPWQGSLRFYMSHLTMGDEFDVMGSGLAGLPFIAIGFTEKVAWSHTVSTGSRFNFYELELNPENPMEYIYDGEIREITSQTVTAEQQTEDGSIEVVEHTFYFSHFGPIINLGAVHPLLAGWPNAVGTLLTYRDANLDNVRGFDQWVKMGQADNLTELKDALRAMGNPWFNTIAADRNGDAFYGDISVVPHISVNQYNTCIRGTLQPLLTDFGFTTLDGSDSECEWGSDEDTPEGIFGYDSLPKIETRGYVANSNDSYWLSSPDMLLEGFSPLIGPEGVEQSIRTRQAFVQAEQRLVGTDGLGEGGFNVDNIRDVLFGSRSLVAEMIGDDIVRICSEVDDWTPYGVDTASAALACTVLAAWDKRSKVDSVGTHIFSELWLTIRSLENLWAIPFDVTDPVNTPRELNVTDADLLEVIRINFAGTVNKLTEAGIPMDRPWGEIQFDERNGTRYPIHGASHRMGFSVIASNLVEGEGYSAIRAGNSYIQAVTWDESDCPDAYAILSYSQSTDPESANYEDSTELYSKNGWIDMPFCEAARDEQEVRRETVQE